MAHKIDLVMDFQFGSTGKGLLAGWLAKRFKYDTVACSFATNAGHTYIDEDRGIHMMTQQLPTGISCPTVQIVLIGPGALVHLPTLFKEMEAYRDMLKGKQVVVHPCAAIVTDEHSQIEQANGSTKIGSTAKGVGAAAIQRIRRDPMDLNVAGAPEFKAQLQNRGVIVDAEYYRDAAEHSQMMLVEGAQGFSLSMYHGFYPYTTSRDVTPWQIAADCGLPFKMAPYIQIWGTLRTFPIRVNNRDGTSGPGYFDQDEIDWADLGLEPERTTVTKLPRRVFTFSQQQYYEAAWHCGGYWQTNLFLNFANYHGEDQQRTRELIEAIEGPRMGLWNVPRVTHIGFGPDDSDVMLREAFDMVLDSGRGFKGLK